MIKKHCNYHATEKHLPKYKLRKLSVGLVSFLAGSLILGYSALSVVTAQEISAPATTEEPTRSSDTTHTIEQEKQAAISEMDQALANKNAEIDRTPNLTPEEISDYKNAAKAPIDGGKVNINAVNNSGAIQSAKQDALEAMRTVVPLAKTTAKQAIDAALNAKIANIDQMQNVDPEEKQAAKTAATNGANSAKGAIDRAQTQTAIDDEKQRAIEAINAVTPQTNKETSETDSGNNSAPETESQPSETPAPKAPEQPSAPGETPTPQAPEQPSAPSETTAPKVPEQSKTPEASQQPKRVDEIKIPRVAPTVEELPEGSITETTQTGTSQREALTKQVLTKTPNKPIASTKQLTTNTQSSVVKQTAKQLPKTGAQFVVSNVFSGLTLLLSSLVMFKKKQK